MYRTQKVDGRLRRDPVAVLRFPVLADRLFRVGDYEIGNSDLCEIFLDCLRPSGKVKQDVAGGPVAFRQRIPHDLADRNDGSAGIYVPDRAVKTATDKIIGRDSYILV